MGEPKRAKGIRRDTKREREGTKIELKEAKMELKGSRRESNSIETNRQRRSRKGYKMGSFKVAALGIPWIILGAILHAKYIPKITTSPNNIEVDAKGIPK